MCKNWEITTEDLFLSDNMSEKEQGQESGNFHSQIFSSFNLATKIKNTKILVILTSLDTEKFTFLPRVRSQANPSICKAS